MVQRKAPDANTVASCTAMASFHQMKHAAMAETLPNYMKPTTSSDGKKQHACVSSSEDLKKKKKKKNCKALRIQPKKASVRATCSSTLKSCKFPEFLELGHGGTEAEGASAVKVCPYKYCSLNGHLHGQADIPPLKTFLASRRESMKQRGASPFRKRDTGQAAAAARTRSGLEISSLIEEIGLDLLLEQPAAVEEEDDRNDACSDRSSDGVYSLEALAGFVEYVSCDRDVEEDRTKKGIEDGNQFMAESIDFMINLEKEEEDDDEEEEEEEEEAAELELKKMDKSDNNTPKEHALLDQEQPATEEEARNEDVQIADTNDQDHNNGSVLIVTDSNSNIIAPTDDHGPNVRLMHITRKNSRDEESEQLKGFDPRAPNFLPEEPDPESEKVDLRHQMMDERKNAEEWMIDYALQQTVTKLGSARRKKVALLVEAFETVIPLPPLQACR